MNCAEKLLEPTIPQFIHQVTIEFRLRKSLAQERFKSYLEFRYQIIVSSGKFRKNLEVKKLLRFLKPTLEIYRNE